LPANTDNSDHPNTLPPPELNPLLNPLLGAHMGRWAEVYFTSPPEKRDQAVWDLLLELKAEQSSSVGPAAPATRNGEQVPTHPVPVREVSRPSVRLPEVRPDLITCSACGFESPARQRFCGMCGTRLAEAPAPGYTPSADLPPAPSAAAETDRRLESNLSSEPDPTSTPTQSSEADQRSADQRSAVNEKSEPYPEPETGPSTHVLDEFPWRRDETSLFRIAEEVRPHGIRGSLFADTADGSVSYRRYLVAAIVVATLALGYIGWRALQNQPRAALPTAPAAQEQTSAPASVANRAQSPSPSQVSTTQPSAAQPSDIAASVSASARTTAPATTKTSTVESTTNHEPAQNPPTSQRTSTVIAADPFMPLTAESGATDLAMARSYLNGSDGHERNSSEAADWLWRAVSKKNAEATLLLADLYLRGDGVSKNCDQARVLLDAAARKGSKDAAERLRNLQAFGCE